MHVYTRLIEIGIQLDEDIEVIGQLCEEAVEIIMASRNMTPEAARNMQTKNSIDFEDPVVCFPILTGLLTMYRLKRIADDANLSNERRICDLLLTIARSNPTKYAVHIAVGLSFMRNVHHHLGEIDKGVQCMEGARAIYQFDEHSNELIEVYGQDRMPRCFGCHMQVLILQGNLPKALDYMEQLKSIFPRLTQSYSISHVIMPLFAASVELGKIEDGYDFAMECVNGKKQGVFDLFQEANLLVNVYIHSLLRWYLDETANGSCKVVKHLQKGVTPAASDDQNEASVNKGQNGSTLSSPVSIVLDQKSDVSPIVAKHRSHSQLINIPREVILARIVEQKFLRANDSQRSIMFFALDFFGVGIEFMAAKVVYLEAVHLLADFETEEERGVVKLDVDDERRLLTKIQDYLEIASAYLENYLMYLGNNPDFSLCRFKSLVLRCKVLYHVLLVRKKLEEKKIALLDPAASQQGQQEQPKLPTVTVTWKYFHLAKEDIIEQMKTILVSAMTFGQQHQYLYILWKTIRLYRLFFGPQSSSAAHSAQATKQQLEEEDRKQQQLVEQYKLAMMTTYYPPASTDRQLSQPLPVVDTTILLAFSQKYLNSILL